MAVGILRISSIALEIRSKVAGLIGMSRQFGR